MMFEALNLGEQQVNKEFKFHSFDEHEGCRFGFGDELDQELLAKVSMNDYDDDDDVNILRGVKENYYFKK